MRCVAFIHAGKAVEFPRNITRIGIMPITINIITRISCYRHMGRTSLHPTLTAPTALAPPD